MHTNNILNNNYYGNNNNTSNAYYRDKNTISVDINKNIESRKLSKTITVNPSPNLNSNQISNKQFTFVPQNPLNNDNSSLNYNTPRDNTELKKKIEKENEYLKELEENQIFFDKEFNKQLSKFKKDIQPELKEKFDKTLKKALHYLWKHYENIKKKLDPEYIKKALEDNLTKVKQNEISLKEKYNELLLENNTKIQKLYEDINKDYGFYKRKKQINIDSEDNINTQKESIKKSIADLEIKNNQIEKKIEDLKKNKEKEQYNLRLKYEMKGRELMEEQAIELALAYNDHNSSEINNTKKEVSDLMKEMKTKRKMIEDIIGEDWNEKDYITDLEQREKFLIKEIERLKLEKNKNFN